MTAHTTLGEYAVADATGIVASGSAADVRIAMEPAAAVEVTFDVTLPANTPNDAVIRVAGNVFQLGAYRVHQNLPRLVQDVDLAPLERVSATRARGTFALHEGTYLNYYYTLGGTYWGREFDDESQPAYHEAMVSGGAARISDRVQAWMAEGEHLVALRVTTPPDTEEDGFLAVTVGPRLRAARVGRTEFVAYFQGHPGEVIEYSFNWGDSEINDGSPGLGPNGMRQLTVGEADSTQAVTIERWTGHRDVSVAAPGSTVDIAFVASLPMATPDDVHVGVVVERGPATQRFDLAKVAGGPLWEGTVRLTEGATVTYWIDASGDEPRRGPDRSMTVEYVGQVVNDWVTAWSDAPLPRGGTRPEYITGVYTPDLFSSAMQTHTTPTYERIAEHNGGWVALSSVWHYGQILPKPTIESRQVHAPGVRTPRPHVVEQARKAKAAGLKTLLAPQFNMEMVPGFGDQLNEIGSDAWWDGWYEVAETLWLYHADLAAEVDADALLLPGFVFHVFSGPGRFESQASFERFDARLIELADRVRQVYDGKLLISGGVQESAFPGVADLVGVTTYDTGKPDLPASASVEEWHAAYDALFVDAVDPLWERWGVPVLLYTINIEAPFGGVGDEVEQARQLEGILRAVETRPWIAGSFMWSYLMNDQPTAENGLRNRLGEAVMAKVYGAFVGAD